ncbi:hypothetical protein KR032_010126 [Drosophila birchii]|nr:hypothetical protein KR032_010126 [Drosophila birchii]
MKGDFDDSLTKKQQKKLKKKQNKLKKDAKLAEAEPTCTTKGVTKPKTKGIKVKGTCATDAATEGKTAKKFKVPRKPLGKRACSPDSTDNQQDLKKKKKKKKKKLEDSKTGQEVAIAGSSKKSGVTAKKKKKEQQEPEAFKAPDSPPTTSKGKASTAPTTPKGVPPMGINPLYTPARPKGVSRLIKDDDVVEEASDWEYEDNETDTDSSSADESDSDTEGSSETDEDNDE